MITTVPEPGRSRIPRRFIGRGVVKEAAFPYNERLLTRIPIFRLRRTGFHARSETAA